MINYLTAGLVLGVSAGLQPGPLTALVVRAAARGGFAAAARVAFAPLLTDGPIILVAVLLLRPMREYGAVLSALAVGGAAYCLWLARETWRLGAAPAAAADTRAPAGSLREAVVVNLLNPNPYLFWLTAGGAWLGRGGAADGAVFVAAFMVGIVGTKVAVAWVAARARTGGGRVPPWIARALALALVVFAVQMLVAAVRGGPGS
ncbi:MAG: hypothetical protein HONDAALG_03148 [Gammaproteobacteria bacterium]|nr:hypothetical protein [Gammaproteobacteria bacterium]